MKYNSKFWYGLLCVLFLINISACRKTKVSAQELEEYITKEENGLVQTSVENNLKVQAIFRPSDLLVFQEIKNSEHLTASALDEIRNKYDRNIYITVNISQQGQDPLYQSSGDPVRYAEALKQLVFRMSEKAVLITSTQDTIPAADYSFAPMFNTSGAVSVMFVFAAVNMTSSEWIDIELKDPGLNVGDRKFRFEKENIEKLPGVKMEIIKES